MDGESNCPALIAGVRSVVVQAFQAKAACKSEHVDCLEEGPDVELKARVHRGLQSLLGTNEKLKIYTGFLLGDPMISILIADCPPLTFVAGQKKAESLREAAAMEVASCIDNPSHVDHLQLPGVLHHQPAQLPLKISQISLDFSSFFSSSPQPPAL